MGKTETVQHFRGRARIPSDGLDAVVLSEPGGLLLANCHAARVSTPRELAIARRFAACWSACEGISTEALEAGAVKELVEVGKRAEPYLPSESEMLDYASLNEGRASGAGVAGSLLRAAISKAEPEGT